MKDSNRVKPTVTNAQLQSVRLGMGLSVHNSAPSGPYTRYRRPEEEPRRRPFLRAQVVLKMDFLNWNRGDVMFLLTWVTGPDCEP